MVVAPWLATQEAIIRSARPDLSAPLFFSGCFTVSGDAGRILGLDAGERRIGVAIADPGLSFALPLESLLVDGRELDRLAALAEAEGVTEVVVGLPLSMSGEDSAQTERAREFATRVGERLGVNVHLWDERLSSREAERLAGPRPGGRERGRGARAGRQGPDTDALAASIILQAYLDRRRLQG